MNSIEIPFLEYLVLGICLLNISTMNYNVILITDTSEYPVWNRGIGAHRMANHLRQHGYSCLVLDFSSALSFDDWCKICELAIGPDTLMIGFSTTWWPYRSAKQKTVIVNLNDFTKTEHKHTYFKNGLTEAAVNGTLDIWINKAKEYNSKIKILLGGSKIDFYKDISADNFIVGFGETQTIEYLDSLRSNRRLWSRFIDHDKNAENGTFDFRNSQTLYTELDFIKSEEPLTIEFTRGCKFKCAFCSYPMIGRKNVVEESLKYKEILYAEFMENYNRWGTTKYWVADDTFNDSVEKLRIILDVINKLPFKPQFKAYTRLDVLATKPEQIDLLKNIGIVNTWFGIDSMHPTASRIIGKAMDINRKKDTLYKVREKWGKDVIIKVGYILGLPGEDSNYARDIVNWFLDPNNPVDEIVLNPLRILPTHPEFPTTPRSDIDLNYEKYGYSIPNLSQFWEWTKNDGTDLTTFTKTAILSAELNDKIHQQNTYIENFDTIVIKDPKTEYFDPLITKLSQS
jgi:hypothetical protein